MLKWIVILLIAVGIYYAAQNWSMLTAHWSEGLASLSNATPQKGTAIPQGYPKQATDRAGFPSFGSSWGMHHVGSLQVELPFPLEPYHPPDAKPPPANVRLEFYAGQSGAHRVVIGHGTNTTMAGGLALTAFNKPLEKAADGLSLDVISINSATTMLHGFRARRSDYISRSSPRDRVRCVLLERGNQAWFIEAHCPEANTAGEGFFQRLANSAQ
ncbi:MAG: hypothetical protein WDN28_09330 [Chthoniobacter sp.]